MDISILYQLYLTADGVVTDSRHNVNNKIFFALSGPNFDGSDYVESVLAKGAKLAITNNQKFKGKEHVVCVRDALKTLQKLATFHREQLNIPVFAITGSNGKTTTKELIYQVLSKKYNVLATKGNYNNLLGLPLTMLRANADHDIMVLEMGSNAFGEIEQLCQIAKPNFGLITNIGAAHLEGFNNLDGVLNEKLSLYRFIIRNGGTIFVPAFSEKLMRSTIQAPKKIQYQYGVPEEIDKINVLVQPISMVPEIKASFQSNNNTYRFQSTLSGEHNLQNCTAAVAVGLFFEVNPELIVLALKEYKARNNRSQIIRVKGLTVLLDAYNANPVSMNRALDVLDDWPAKQKIVILGDMKELGEHARSAHSSIVKRLQNSEIDMTFLVGEQFGLCTSKAFDSTDELKNYLFNNPIEFDDTVLLIKGSRSMGLERILPALTIDLEQV